MSTELTEIVYTDDAAVVDYDASMKNYVVSEDAEAVADVSDLDETTYAEESTEHVEQTVPVFGNPPNTDEPVEQVLYNPDSGLDRSAPIFSEETQHSDAGQTDEEQDDAEEAGSQVDEEAEQGEGSTGGESQGEGEGISQGGEGDTGVGGTGAGEEGEDAPSGVSEDAPAYNTSGNLVKPVSASRVATVGEMANMTMMIGGKGALVAADSSFLNNAQVQKIFGSGDWDFDSIVSAWSVDMAGNYVCDFEALLAAEPDLVLIPEGTTLLSQDQIDQLLAAGIYVEPVPTLSSVSKIKTLAAWLGDSLGEEAAARAERYTSQYLGSDVSALISENGGLTTSMGVDFSGQGGMTSSSSNWTVLITDWDSTATFTSTLTAKPWTARGVAIARSGYGWSPVDYYLSVGGVCNNAALFPSVYDAANASGNYYVWQFNMGQLSPALVSNASIAVSSFDATNGSLSGSTMCLVGAQASINRDDTFTTTLGQADFRYLICANQTIAQALAAQRDVDTYNQTGLYAAYDYSEADAAERGVGPRTTTGVLIRSWIGAGPSGGGVDVGGAAKSWGRYYMDGGYNPYEVVTCANGLYCDWIEGSVESFLMAFWTDDFYDGDASFQGLCAEAQAFYQEFYGYSLTAADLQEICAGRVS